MTRRNALRPMIPQLKPLIGMSDLLDSHPHHFTPLIFGSPAQKGLTRPCGVDNARGKLTRRRDEARRAAAGIRGVLDLRGPSASRRSRLASPAPHRRRARLGSPFQPGRFTRPTSCAFDRDSPRPASQTAQWESAGDPPASPSARAEIRFARSGGWKGVSDGQPGPESGPGFRLVRQAVDQPEPESELNLKGKLGPPSRQ